MGTSTFRHTHRLPGSQRVAHAAAYVVNPFVLPPLLFSLVLAHAGAPPYEIAVATTIAAVFFAIVPAGYVLWLVRQQRVASVEIRDRRQRTVPFLIGLASTGVALVLFLSTVTTGRTLVAALTGCHLINTSLIVVINLRWKISVHTAGIAGFLSILFFVATTGWNGIDAGGAGTPLLRPGALLVPAPLLPLLMWARVHTGAHTRWQVVAGALFGLVVPYLELLVLHRLGMLAG